MPYKIFPIRGEDKKINGYKVGKHDGNGKHIRMSNGRWYASNKLLTKKEALSQMRAIYLNEK
jgi:hypothetical protein